MEISITPISKDFNLKNFDCGIQELNLYLHQFALRNDRKNIGKTFIAWGSDNPKKVLGYYTVSMAQVLFEELPPELKAGLPKYPVPAMRIGRLAVDSSLHGKGFGSWLLKDALSRAALLSDSVALFCILVDALNDKAKDFYLKYGFKAFEDKPLTLVLPVETVKLSVKTE